ncbi:hypothetical protein LTR84_006352 [Exophiala bonariae]|uniref:Methyltransferase domain-containing protein n=1 Tax=Exophiala bonariae TaxID=1690606 RepID=A0AAV9N4U9_9EURO|nr:hypothetical protein LTR84_006352 [Exophiala bonariae]
MSESIDNPVQVQASSPSALAPESAAQNHIQRFKWTLVWHLTFAESDSTLGVDNTSVTSASFSSSIQNHKYENGRRYHAFREGTYPLPNDEPEPEQERQDLLHHIFRLILRGKLLRAPLEHAPPRVLDVGTGTGIWVLDFGDEFAESSVIGTDLSPIQLTWIPPNCNFVIDDAESD